MVDVEKEIRTLTHYIRKAWEAAGLPWDHDNEAEIEMVVQGIADAAAQTAIDEMARQ